MGVSAPDAPTIQRIALLDGLLTIPISNPIAEYGPLSPGFALVPRTTPLILTRL